VVHHVAGILGAPAAIHDIGPNRVRGEAHREGDGLAVEIVEADDAQFRVAHLRLDLRLAVAVVGHILHTPADLRGACVAGRLDDGLRQLLGKLVDIGERVVEFARAHAFLVHKLNHRTVVRVRTADEHGVHARLGGLLADDRHLPEGRAAADV